MQGALASGYVGQTVKIALGKSTLVSRVAYIDSPASRSSEAASRLKQVGPHEHNPSYWPGATYTRLRPELIPTRGPLSRPHYLHQQHSSRKASNTENANSAADSSIEGAEAQVSAEHELSPSRDAHASHRTEYYTHERGQLLDLGEHKSYHDARLRNAAFVCQAPVVGSMPVVRRSVIEASGSVIAQDHDLKIVSISPRMIVGQPESGFLKPQLRASQNRASRASNSFLKDMCVVQRRERGYINLNDALDEHMDYTYAQERFSAFDMISNQRTMRQVDSDNSSLSPPLTLQDVSHFESVLDGTKEAMETRWSRFFESSLSQTVSPIRGPTFKFWDDSRRLFFHRLSLNLQFGRKEEIFAVTEALRPKLSELRKANPFNRPKSHGGSKNKNGAHHRDNQIKVDEPIKNEDWPSVFQNPFSSLLPQHINELCKTELSRSLVIGLVMFAASSTTHPIAPGMANVISNLVLSPLGYNNNPNGAHLLLTHLGVPLCDPLDLPFLFNLAEEDGTFLRSYPFLPNKDPLELFIKPTEGEAVTTPSLGTISPRHFEVQSFGALRASSCNAASQILRDSIQKSESGLNEETKTYLSSLADAGANPEFRFSLNLPTMQSITIDGAKDSSQLLKFADLDADGRKDLSALPSFAIDDSSTTEVDDAFALDMDALLPYAKQILQDRPLGSSSNSAMDDPSYSGPKTARILIHIADPTTVMREGDELELTARERVETVYLPHRKSFMLPSVLSEFYCSLHAHPHKNIALTFEAHVDLRTGELVKHDVFPSKFNSMKRLTYDHVQNVLHPQLSGKSSDTTFYELIGKPLIGGVLDPAFAAPTTGTQAQLSEKEELALKILGKIARLRKQWRVDVGKAETMHLLKSGVKVDATTSQPKITLASEGDNTASQSLVEEMMVLVGEITGRTARDGDFAVPYRRQENRTSLILEPFDHTLYTPHPNSDPMLWHAPSLASRPSYQSILECELSRMKLVSDLGHLNYMNQSSTSSIPLPHRSLGLTHYSRASSPLRRYADIIGHLQLKAWKRYGGDKSKLPYSPSLVHSLSQHINFVSKDIKWSQQNSERWWKQQYVLRNCMDRSPSNEFKAIVYATPNLDMASGYVHVSSGKPLLYSFFILGLDIILQLPTPVHLSLGQIVSVRPSALSELHLEWTVVPHLEQSPL